MSGHHQHSHDRNGDDHQAVGEGGRWANPDDDRPLSLARRDFLAGIGLSAGTLALGAMGSAAAAGTGLADARNITNPWTGNDRWWAGDHHIHSKYSQDGQYEVATLVSRARKHGLDWMVVTDHGNISHEKFSIKQIAPDIDRARDAYRDMLVYQGLEWNVPGAEHATVFLPPGRHTEDILHAFEVGYDGEILAAPTSLGGRGLITRATSADGERYALAALEFLQHQVASGRTEIALMIANHPSRRGLDSPHELRGWRDTAPRVAIGMEGAPGHQAAGLMPGGPGGDARGYYDKSPVPDSFAGYAPSSTENPYRTYGGFDWMTAKVGGLWDSLLAEGKAWWVTSSQDTHRVMGDTYIPGGEDYSSTGTVGAPIDTGVPQANGDFWPGAYSRTLVGAPHRSYLAIMRSLQQGKVVAVHGGLVNGLDLRVRARTEGDNRGVTQGGRTAVRRGGDIEVTIDLALPMRPNDSGEVPRLAKIDMIAGPITGPVADADSITAPHTSVVKTFEVAGAARRHIRFTHVFRRVERSFYLRLRGTDGNRLTSGGDPIMDAAGIADPWGDLWFYGNPVFVHVYP